MRRDPGKASNETFHPYWRRSLSDSQLELGLELASRPDSREVLLSLPDFNHLHLSAFVGRREGSGLFSLGVQRESLPLHGGTSSYFLSSQIGLLRIL